MNTAKKIEKSLIEEKFLQFEDFCRCLLDAYVVLDDQGMIVKFNRSFANILNLKPKDIDKSNDFFQLLNLKHGLNTIDINLLTSNKKPMRYDEVQAITFNNQELYLIIGVYPFMDHSSPIGTFITLRDVTAEVQLQSKFKKTTIQSNTDALTGLKSRYYYEGYLRSIVKDENKFKHTLAIVDIDHFKTINDKYGHPTGDFVLKTIGLVMSEWFNKNFTIGRLGGEEFVIIMPDTNLQTGHSIMDSFRGLIENIQFIFDNQRIKLTVSSGLACINQNEDMKGLIARADSCLYSAKSQGRNQVVSHIKHDNN